MATSSTQKDSFINLARFWLVFSVKHTTKRAKMPPFDSFNEASVVQKHKEWNGRICYIVARRLAANVTL